MNGHWARWSRVLGCALGALWVGSAWTAAPRIVDKKLGEEEQIRRRTEWFYGSRRAGTPSDRERGSLRRAAVLETRQALAAQRARQFLGFEGGQNAWVSMGPSPSNYGGWAFGTVSGRIQALAADWAGGVLYAGAASGGVWKSTNDGLSWTSIFDNAGSMTVGAIQVDPNDPDVLWVGTGDNIEDCESYFGIGLLRSPDGGQTWEPRNGMGAATLEDLASFAGITVDPRDSNRLVVGGRLRGCASGAPQAGGIYSSDDGGTTWTSRLSGKEVHEIARDPAVPDVLWAGTSSGVYKSTNNGVIWLLQTASGLPSGNLERTEIAISPSDPATVYALFDVPSDELWRTTNGGASWTRTNTDACDGQCWYNMVLRVDPNDPDTLYRGTIRVFKSIDAGSSWTVLTDAWGASQQVHQDTHELLLHPTASGTLYVGSDGGVWKTTNGGGSFTNRNGNLNVTQLYGIGVDVLDTGQICGGAQDNASLVRLDDNVWRRQALTGDGFLCHMDPQDPSYAYVASYPAGDYPSVWRSTNGILGAFLDITGPGSGIVAGDRIAWVTPYLLDPLSPNILFLGTHRAYRSTNHGSSWTQVGPTSLTGSGSGFLTALEVNRNFPNCLFSGASDGAAWRTVNGGTVWSDITLGLPQRSINDIAADPTNADRAFAALGGFNVGHVWEWNDGIGWVERSNGLPNVPANSVLMVSDTEIVVGTDTGVFRSLDSGQSFQPFMAGLPEGLVVTDLKLSVQQNLITAGTYGRGAWQVALGIVEPILQAESVDQPLVELDGDGDVQIEPGETWRVNPILRNAGGVAALAVQARLASSTPGVTVQSPQTASFGDIQPASTAMPPNGYRFTVDPSFVCGEAIVFDLLDITSQTPPNDFADQLAIYQVLVEGEDGPGDTLLDENFDPAPPGGWVHEAVDPDLSECPTAVHVDQWTLTSKDVAHGTSYHCGSGPGGTYSTFNFAWLHPHGRDSGGGPGFFIPAEATAAVLTVEHWYETAPGQDGGQVVLDIDDDDQDLYITINPEGGYTGSLNVGFCNGLEGQEAFAGSSGGWTTSLFDLTPFKDRQLWLAFVFGSDRRLASAEGWYIDGVRIEYQTPGPPVCNVARWPGTVPAALFDRGPAGAIQATWSDACNVASFPEQTYSVQAGNLDTLIGSGSYTHTPVAGLCNRVSPAATFTAGPGNEYYLVIPAGEGREGGPGTDSTGAARPQPGVVCGERRVSCP